MIGEYGEDSRERHRGEDQEYSDDEEGEDMPTTHYLFQLRCILYRRPSQLHDPNDPDAAKIRTETDQDRVMRDNLVSMLRSQGADSVTSASLEFWHSLGYRDLSPTKKVGTQNSPNHDLPRRPLG
jgi:hypothetical protein